MNAKQKKAASWARKYYALPSSDDLEVDDQPRFSMGDNGMWVSAWVWVPEHVYSKEKNE